MLHLDDPPTMAELEDAMGRLKARKVGGLSGIFPELVLSGGAMNYLVCAMNYLVCSMNYLVCAMNYLVCAMNYLVYVQ